MELELNKTETEISGVKSDVTNLSELSNLEREIEPTLSHVMPEIQDEILNLAHSGRQKEAEEELIDYVIADDHSKELRRFTRKKWYRDEWFMDDRIYWLAIIPVAVAFYCIFSVLFTGHIRLP